MKMKIKITTHQIADWLRRGMTAKDIGWEIIGLAIDAAKASGEKAERKAFSAWENATDYQLGFQALALAREAASRGHHLRGTFTVA